MRGGSKYKKIGGSDAIGIMRNKEANNSDSSSPPMEGLCE